METITYQYGHSDGRVYIEYQPNGVKIKNESGKEKIMLTYNKEQADKYYKILKDNPDLISSILGNL